MPLKVRKKKKQNSAREKKSGREKTGKSVRENIIIPVKKIHYQAKKRVLSRNRAFFCDLVS